MNLLPFFLIGLLGAVHCVGMCGGIVSAFTSTIPAGRPLAIPLVSERGRGERHVLAFNAGRLASYMLAGALAGGLTAGVSAWIGIASLQKAGYLLANLMLVALGLFLMDSWRGLSRLEALGQTLWRHVQPLGTHFLPVDRPAKALALGALWGWLPCGLVYSVLMSAMLSGSAVSGALVMLAFGLGTLPALLSIGMLGARLRLWVRRPGLRLVSGAIVLLFGLLGILRSINGVSLGWLDALCVTPAAMP